MPDALEFVQLYVNFRAKEKPLYATKKFQTFCTLVLWNDLTKLSGKADVVAWLMRLATGIRNTTIFPEHPETTFIHREAVQELHRLLNTRQLLGTDAQTFFYLMQHVAEDKGLMQLDETQLDEYIPQEVLQQFLEDFIGGFCNLMQEVGFRASFPLDK
eukprot:TRINITY_DN8834_c0_g1_i3.p1 TRINITY_DN8834_c0_g1~~TRINITY_DN8834_c0_g1_i3.p1  ORF type:complete len:176 (+),score=45.78 TRINITY_DN8834_c0_g1_i3:57-530(+)